MSAFTKNKTTSHNRLRKNVSWITNSIGYFFTSGTFDIFNPCQPRTRPIPTPHPLLRDPNMDPYQIQCGYLYPKSKLGFHKKNIEHHFPPSMYTICLLLGGMSSHTSFISITNPLLLRSTFLTSLSWSPPLSATMPVIRSP